MFIDNLKFCFWYKFHSKNLNSIFLLFVIGLDLDGAFPNQMDQSTWPKMKAKFTEVFLSKTRQEWCDVFDGMDACVTPVLDLTEAAEHSQNIANGVFLKDADGTVEPGPAPKLSRTPATVTSTRQPQVGENTREVLQQCGYSHVDIDVLEKDGVIYCKNVTSSL